MSLQSMKQRIDKLDTSTRTPSRVFRPDSQGVIPDEFEPGTDLLVYRVLISPETKAPCLDQPITTWRGNPYFDEAA